MTAQQIVDREILYEQSYVINELIRVNGSLWDKIENSDELDEVFEWWLVTPYMAELLKENGEVIFADYDCYWWGRQVTGQPLTRDAVLRRLAKKMWVDYGEGK